MTDPFKMLGGQSNPEGILWRCSCCDFTCGDDGPDFCPEHGKPMTRLMGTIPTSTWMAR